MIAGHRLLAILYATVATAQAEPVRALETKARVAADLGIGLGGAVVSYAEQTYDAPTEVIGVPLLSLGLGVGVQLSDSRTAILFRAKAALGRHGAYDLMLLGFAGIGARISLMPRVFVHAALGYSGQVVQHGDYSSQVEGVTALLRAELVRGPLAFGLETTPYLFGGYRSDELRILELTATVSVRR